MLISAIVLAAVALWIFVLVLVLALCKYAKAGDEAMAIALGRTGTRDGENRVILRVVGQRDRDARELARLA